MGSDINKVGGVDRNRQGCMNLRLTGPNENTGGDTVTIY